MGAPAGGRCRAVERKADATIRAVRTETIELAFVERLSREGRAVVLLHGYPDDPHRCDDVVAALAPDGFRILVPYLRGYGPTRFLRSGMVRSGQQAALGADLRDMLAALDLGDVIPGGMDWGGRTACLVSALWPERGGGLVTCNDYNVRYLSSADEPADPGQAVRHWYRR